MIPSNQHRENSDYAYRRRQSSIVGIIISVIVLSIFGFILLGNNIPINGFPSITIMPVIFLILGISGILRILRFRSYRARGIYSRSPPTSSTTSQSTQQYQGSFSNQPKPRKETSSYCPACGAALEMILEKNQSTYCSHCGEKITK